MTVLRRALAALGSAALVCVGVGVGTAGAATEPGTVQKVPKSIASDCSVDVTAELGTWIAGAPKRSTLELARDGCYRVDGSLILYSKVGLTLDGRGATLQALTPGDRNRRLLWVRGGKDLVVRNLTVRGANPNAGAGRESFVGQKAFQHGIALHGVHGARLENVTVRDVYGDFVYLGSARSDRDWTRDVTITGSRFEGSGRQGIAIVAAKRVVIDDNYIGGAGQSLIDLEANSADGGAVDVRITHNTTGAARHFWLANKGGGVKIRDIVVANNTAVEPTAGLVFVYGPLTGYRGPYVFAGNTFSITGNVWDERSRGAFFLSRARDVTIRRNQVTLPVGRNVPAVENRDSIDVVVTGNDFRNAGEKLITTHREPAPTTPPATTPPPATTTVP